MNIRILLIVLLVLIHSYSYAEPDKYYMYVDDEGVATFTDALPNSGSGEALSRLPRTTSNPSIYDIDAANKYKSLIRKMARKHNLDPTLITAVIAAESNFDSLAVSKKGAMGLMQIMPETALHLGLYEPFNAEKNIEAGTKYLKYLLKKFGGDLRLALAAYNAGPTRVSEYGTVPPIKETVSYIKRIFSIYKGRKIISTTDDEGKDSGYNKNVVYRVVLNDGTVLYTDSIHQVNMSYDSLDEL